MFARRVLHHGPDPTAAPVALSDRAIGGCWFELQRQGGCGTGELVLKDRFPERDQVEIGDWISLEYAAGDRWYLGRVEQRQADSPAGVRFRLEGMGIELNEVFPGGFSQDIDGVPPHRFGRTDLFSNDPDYAVETVDTASVASDVVTLLMQRYVTPATHIIHDPLLIVSPPDEATVASIKFRGEESVRSIIKELALVARGASWGVGADGKFFFLQKPSTLLATFREGQDVTSLEESRDREFLFNRVLLTGDYIYDVLDSSTFIARRSFRYRGNYLQPESRDEHGERRIRMWVPWLRTAEDVLAFVREFFRVYAQPTSRFLVETDGRSTLLRPWDGRVRLEDRDGAELFTGHVETVRVMFDHVPRFRLELGPEDPRTLWPEPPHDERWELPEVQKAGGKVSLTEETSSDELTSGATSDSLTSAGSTGSSGFSSGFNSSLLASSSGGSTSAATSESGDSSAGDSSGAMSSGGESSGGVSGTDPPNSSGGGASSGIGESSSDETSSTPDSSSDDGSSGLSGSE
jgi:hypothetical protein